VTGAARSGTTGTLKLTAAGTRKKRSELVVIMYRTLLESRKKMLSITVVFHDTVEAFIFVYPPTLSFLFSPS
jgi:hypothetical protein